MNTQEVNDVAAKVVARHASKRLKEDAAVNAVKDRVHQEELREKADSIRQGCEKTNVNPHRVMKTQGMYEKTTIEVEGVEKEVCVACAHKEAQRKPGTQNFNVSQISCPDCSHVYYIPKSRLGSAGL
ncbi:MAG: hypothetical protein U9Q03_04560 [Patescibacteria group bacterium]|nr:hypothetical protein [Patescibacteria group bacterium]